MTTPTPAPIAGLSTLDLLTELAGRVAYAEAQRDVFRAERDTIAAATRQACAEELETLLCDLDVDRLRWDDADRVRDLMASWKQPGAAGAGEG